MKRSLIALVAVLVLAGGYLYLFPDVQLLSDHCIACGRSRVYYQLGSDKYGSTIYNMQVERPGDTSPSHPHTYVDPLSSDVRRMFRCRLHPSGTQFQ